MGGNIAKESLEWCEVGRLGGEVQVGYLRGEVVEFRREECEDGSNIDARLEAGEKEREKHLFPDG